MPDKSIRTINDWLDLAIEGKEEWNKQVALLNNPDFIDFRNAKISIPLSFAGFKFPVKVNFARAQFNYKMDFSHAVFESDAFFTNAEFHGEVAFCDAKFHGIARFDDATFNRESSFIKTTFNGDTTSLVCASFTDAKFNGSAFFDEAVFSKIAIFVDATFKFLAQFRVTRFQGAVDFRGAKFDRSAEFVEAVFYKQPMFNAEDLHGHVYFNQVAKFGKQFMDVESRGAEVDYRELKLAMKRIEAHPQEDAFFRLEMLARKRQEPWARKWLYWLYEILSDYGQSIFRPLAWLIVFSIAFHGVYLRLGLGKEKAMELALENTLIFPGMFSGGLDDGMELTGLKIVLVGGVHWLLSAASWFLMLLGLRNRFRLK